MGVESGKQRLRCAIHSAFHFAQPGIRRASTSPRSASPVSLIKMRPLKPDNVGGIPLDIAEGGPGSDRLPGLARALPQVFDETGCHAFGQNVPMMNQIQ